MPSIYFLQLSQGLLCNFPWTHTKTWDILVHLEWSPISKRSEWLNSKRVCFCLMKTVVWLLCVQNFIILIDIYFTAWPIVVFCIYFFYRVPHKFWRQFVGYSIHFYSQFYYILLMNSNKPSFDSSCLKLDSLRLIMQNKIEIRCTIYSRHTEHIY